MKPQVAFYWCASCGGCEEAILDLGEDVLKLTAAVDIVFWPVALDFKEKDIEAMDDHSIDICFINGAVRTSDQQKMAWLLRRKSKLVVAFGACAQLGGIPGLANLASLDSLLREVYGEEEPPELKTPIDGHTLTLPSLFDSVLPLDRVVPVDYYVPGCPPTPNIIARAVDLLTGNDLPETGLVLAPDYTLCEECPRLESRPQKLHVERFRRVQEGAIDPGACILAQGVACLGAATRAGCGARCIAGNMPCTGCFGPTSRIRDFGAKALSSIASIAAGSEPRAIDEALEGIPDPVGAFYRYSLPCALLQPKPQE